ncbi:MAG: DUF1329 domain-containing protein [Deltaproteobacteria bacterium]|nr:DUF1329 domain-containing protein [Deltaproteobacteria bacterium]
MTAPGELGWKGPGSPYPDPYPNDPVLFSITADQAEKYAANLSAGQRALLMKHPGTYRINVYPSRRPHAAPQWVYESTFENATRATGSANGDGVAGAYGGIPFPLPQNGAQVVWNHLLRWQGPGSRRSADTFVMESNAGLYPVVELEVWHRSPYYLLPTAADGFGGDYSDILYQYVYPPDWKGTILLAKDHFSQDTGGRKAWLYEVGQRRVRQYVNYIYDSPDRQLGGVVGVDDQYMFNGPLDRFDWSLVGKQEIYIPYNCYKAESGAAPPEIFAPGHLNPAYVRWELHRTWIVEAVRRKGQAHVYGRRVFYVDEDSWNVVLADAYDGQGVLWRTNLALTVAAYDLPGVVQRLTVHHDLPSGRYVSFKPEATVFGTVKPDSFFTPEQMRAMGRR